VIGPAIETMCGGVGMRRVAELLRLGAHDGAGLAAPFRPAGRDAGGRGCAAMSWLWVISRPGCRAAPKRWRRRPRRAWASARRQFGAGVGTPRR
jgi:hypothetical protein